VVCEIAQLLQQNGIEKSFNALVIRTRQLNKYHFSRKSAHDGKATGDRGASTSLCGHVWPRAASQDTATPTARLRLLVLGSLAQQEPIKERSQVK